MKIWILVAGCVVAVGCASRQAAAPASDATLASAEAASADPSCAIQPEPSALSEAQIATVVEYVVAELRAGKSESEFRLEDVVAATGVPITEADVPTLQARVVAAVSADSQLATARTSRCSDYGACSLTRDLSGASGELLEMYHREKKADMKVFAAKGLPVFQATDLAGVRHSSEELDGRALVVTLAGHCSHSVDAVPVLNALHDALTPEGIRVIGLVVNSGSAQDVGAWYPQLQARYEVWVHPGTEIGDAIGSHLVPTYLLVADRHIKQQLIGFKDRSALDAALRDQLEAGL